MLSPINKTIRTCARTVVLKIVLLCASYVLPIIMINLILFFYQIFAFFFFFDRLGYVWICEGAILDSAYIGITWCSWFTLLFLWIIAIFGCLLAIDQELLLMCICHIILHSFNLFIILVSKLLHQAHALLLSSAHSTVFHLYDFLLWKAEPLQLIYIIS